MGGPSARAAERCWGAQLQGDASGCRFTRKRDTRHFKSKFCGRCRWSIAVSANRVRALSDEVAALLDNRRSAGMWTAAPPRMGGFLYRVVNNTQGCFKSKLVVFEKDPPTDLRWPTVSPDLCDADGMVRMCVSKGTVVPISLVRNPHRAKGPPPETETETDTETEPALEPALELELESDAEAGLLELGWLAPEIEPLYATEALKALESLESLGPLLPVTESVPEVVPEVVHKPEPVLAVAVAVAKEEQGEESPDEESWSKKQARMHRNRVSAARSRDSKRKYIEHLEHQVQDLSCAVEELQKENWYWRSLDATVSDEVLHAGWCLCSGRA